ncbi:MAG: DUF1622 domain-containing protein [Solirubrobacteraceae bacterium]
MSDPSFTDVVDTVSKVIDGAGVVVVVTGIAVATVAFLRPQRDAAVKRGSYRRYREQVGRAILLGLEFLVAGDIIRTVALVPTLEGVTVLAIIVGIRTFLSFTLDVELEGRWPWQQSRAPANPPG